MTEIDGQPVWERTNRERWCRAMADVLVEVDEIPVPPDGAVRAYRPHPQRSYVPPAWARDPTVWEHAIRMFHGATIEARARFIHRDFHPGNVLWRQGHVTGVVDWQHASIGPAVVDVGHNRLNLFFYDRELAQQFTATRERCAGATYQPWADVVAIIGGLDSLRSNPPGAAARTAIEHALDHATRSAR